MTPKLRIILIGCGIAGITLVSVCVFLGLHSGRSQVQSAQLTLQLAEAHLEDGELAEALVCFETAHALSTNPELKARCIEGARECDTGAQLLDLIDLDGEFIEMWQDVEAGRLVALAKRGLVVYDMNDRVEIGRQRFSTDVRGYSLSASAALPDWIAVLDDVETVRTYRATLTGSYDSVSEISVPTILGMHSIGDPLHARLSIWQQKELLILNPDDDFAEELRLPDVGIARASISPNGTRLAVGRGPTVEILDLETQQLLAESSSKIGTFVSHTAFSPDGSQLLVITSKQVMVVSPDTAELIGDAIEIQGPSLTRIIDTWFSDQRIAIRSSTSIDVYDRQSQEHVELRGQNLVLAWEMLKLGADVGTVKAALERAPKLYHLDPHEIVWIGDARALVQLVDERMDVLSITDGKSVETNADFGRVACFGWEPSQQQLWTIGKNGAVARCDMTVSAKGWSIKQSGGGRAPISHPQQILALASGHRLATARWGGSRVEVWRIRGQQLLTHGPTYRHLPHENPRYVLRGKLSETPICTIDLEEGRVVQSFATVNRDHGDVSTDGRFCLTQQRAEEGIALSIVNTTSGEVMARETVQSTSQRPSYLGTARGAENSRIVCRARIDNEWGYLVWEPDRTEFHRISTKHGQAFLVAGGKGLLDIPTSSGEEFAYFWDLADLDATIEPIVIPYPDTFKKIVAAPSRELLYLGADSGKVHIWNPVKGELLRVVSFEDIPEIGDAKLHELFVMPNGVGVLTATDIDVCQAWDDRMESIRWRLSEPGADFYEAKFSDDGELMFYASPGRPPRYRVVSTTDGSLIAEIEGERYVKDYSFRPGTHDVAILSTESIILWDIEAQTHRKIPYDDSAGLTVFYDGYRVVTFDREKTRILDLRRQESELGVSSASLQTGFKLVDGEVKAMSREEWRTAR